MYLLIVQPEKGRGDYLFTSFCPSLARVSQLLVSSLALSSWYTFRLTQVEMCKVPQASHEVNSMGDTLGQKATYLEKAVEALDCQVTPACIW